MKRKGIKEYCVVGPNIEEYFDNKKDAEELFNKTKERCQFFSKAWIYGIEDEVVIFDERN